MDYRRFFPSKQFVFLLGSLLIATLLIYGASFIGSGKKLGSVSSLSSTNNASNVSLVDGDSDGLPDWEEAVRGTDPHTADTDGDGAPDGEEVKGGRNPLKPGPNDTLASAENQKLIQNLTAAASSSNLTDTLSRTFFAQYVNARGEGTSGDSAKQQRMVTDLIANANIGLKGRTYAKKDITIVQDSVSATRAFANESIRIFHRHGAANFKSAIGSLTLAIDNGDESQKARLENIGKEYMLLAQELSEVPVPVSSAAPYLRGINAIGNAGASFHDIGYVNEDPVRSVAGLKNYNVMTAVAAQAFIETAQTIYTSGIKFIEDEPGVEWYSFAAGLLQNVN